MDERKKIEEALDTVGQYFGDIKQACIKGHYTIDTTRMGEMEDILRCIDMYIILNNIENLTGRKKEILGYYLKMGYSKKTKDFIIKNLKLTDSNINNLNHSLRKLGVIKSIGYNQSINEVDKDLLDFKKFMVDSKGEYLLVKIK